MKTQEAQVIMLPTDKASLLLRNTYKFTPEHGNPLSYQKIDNAIERGYEYQHLYFISDESIKEGWQGWVYKEDVKGKVFKHFYTTNPWYADAKKIIATTNPDLWYSKIKNPIITKEYPNVAKIDTTFIEAYVKEQGRIDSVLLEYELVTVLTNGRKTNSYYELALKSNGSVIVHPVKEKMYSKKEAENLVKLAYKAGSISSFTDQCIMDKKISLSDFIKQHF